MLGKIQQLISFIGQLNVARILLGLTCTLDPIEPQPFAQLYHQSFKFG